MEILDLQPHQVGPLERIGSRNDGGYVIPQWLPEKMTLISFGVGDNWSFEKNCLEKKIVSNSIMFDHTVGLGVFLSRIQLRLLAKNFFTTLLVEERSSKSTVDRLSWVTSSPRRSNSFTIAEPANPVAPATSTFIALSLTVVSPCIESFMFIVLLF